MSGWICSHELLCIARCCWGLWKGTHSMAGNCSIEELCHLAPPQAEHNSMLVPAGESLCQHSSWYWAVSPCKTQQLLLLPPAFMEIETSILTSPRSQLLPGNSKVRFYEVVWFVSQLSPKGPALWISCFIGALTLFALWAVGIMFRKVRILLKCKNIIPKFALYQVRTLIFLVRISLNCWHNSVSIVLAPLLKMYSIFSH